MKKIILFFFFINLNLFNNLFANEDPIIIISAGKTIQSLNTVGTTVAIIDEKTIQNSTEDFLGNIINKNATGINIFQSGGPGTVMGIQLRGLEKRYSTVYIDGVKLSDPSSPDNSFYFQNIIKNSIEKVEILKGNQSTLYGSSAIGGAIHIFTKKGKVNQKPNLEIKSGSNNTKNINYSFGEDNNKFNYHIGLNKFTTDGISARNDDSENDKYKNISLITNGGYKFNNNLNLSSSLRYASINSNYDSVSKSLLDDKNSSNDIEASYNIKLDHENNQFNNTLSYNKTYIERKTKDSENAKQNYFGYRDSVSWLGTYNFNLDNKIIFGTEIEFDAARYMGDYAPSATNWKKILADKIANENIFSHYFDYQFRPIENLYTTFGLRNDKHSTAGRNTSGRATFAYQLKNNSVLKSSIGSGIRFPALYDIHYADGNTNVSGGGMYPSDGYLGLKAEDLKAERSNSFDIGYETYLQSLDLVLNLNYFNIKQLNSLVGDSRNNWKVQNTSGVNTSKGIETSFLWKPEKNFNLGINYTYTKTYDSNTCSPDIISSRGCNLTSSKIGNDKVRVPRNAFTANITHNTTNELNNSLNIRFVDEVRDFGDINNNFQDVILDDFITFNFSSKYKLKKNYELNFDVINIFDKKYEQQFGYSSMERSFFLSLKTIY